MTPNAMDAPLASSDGPDRTLERRELAARKEATRRAVQRNASQARGVLEQGDPRKVIEITGLMLRGRNLRTMADPQVPLVYYRGMAYEELGDNAAAAACYRVLAAWNGGPHPIVDDAHRFIDLGVARLVALLGQPPSEGDLPATPPENDPRVFPRPLLTAGRLLAAVAATFLLTVCAGIVLAVI